MKSIYTIILFIAITANGIAQNFNRPVPPALHPYEFDLIDTAFHGYYFTTPFKLGATPSTPGYKSPKAVILDEKGYVILYIASNNVNNTLFRYFPEHNLYGYLRQVGANYFYRILDANFNVIDSIRNTAGIANDGHEFQIISNGNYLIGGQTDSIIDMSADSIGNVLGSAATHARGYVIQEFDHVTHNLVFQWNSNDYIYPTEGYSFYGYNANDYDYCHGNTIEEDSDGNFLVSFRHMNAVYKIERSTGNILWKFGGKSNQFTFTNDNGFSGQHDVRRLPNGHITMFDNENMGALPKISRGVEFSIDTVNMTATRVWEYHDSTGFWGNALGVNQTTANGGHLINYGLEFRPNVSFSFVDSSFNPISKVYYADSVMTYRAHIFTVPFPFQRPVISCTQGLGNVILTAPSGHTKYAWSTGATTQSITVSANGTYQVWVNEGITMVGSLPAIITDINTYCISTSLHESEMNSVVNISPNPFDENISITLKNNEEVLVSIYDITSRKLIEQQISNSTIINTGQLSKGIYLYEIKNKEGILKKGKVVRN